MFVLSVCYYIYSDEFVLISAIQCPPGMVYQQCGPLCPQTCDNIGIINCQGGCTEGCFCPHGKVFHDGRCIEPLTCAGKMHTAVTNMFITFPIF